MGERSGNQLRVLRVPCGGLGEPTVFLDGFRRKHAVLDGVRILHKRAVKEPDKVADEGTDERAIDAADPSTFARADPSTIYVSYCCADSGGGDTDKGADDKSTVEDADAESDNGITIDKPH